MSHSSNQTATVFFFHTHFFSPNVTQFSRQATICTAFYFTFSSMSLVCFIYKIIFFTCIIYPGLTLFTYINNSLFCFNFLFSFRNKLSLVSIYLHSAAASILFEACEMGFCERRARAPCASNLLTIRTRLKTL